MPAPASTEVIIVGAGPAGTAAAITLARAGRDVLLIDKAVFPRDKFCGDGLTTGALRHLESLGLTPSMVPSWTEAANCWIRSPKGITTKFELQRTDGQYLAIAPRFDLDAALVDLAKATGVKVCDGHALAGIKESSDGATVEIHGLGTYRASWVIGADGMWSPLRKMLGLNIAKYRGEWHAFRQYASNVSDFAAQEMYIGFEPDLVPGYFWSFPLGNNRANIGFGIHRASGIPTKAMGPMWEDILARPHIQTLLGPDFELEGQHRAWPIPARVDQLAATSQRTLFVGDAVAACDVMSGEGIAQALITGQRAAEAIIAGSEDNSVTKRYEKLLAQELLADHRMSSLLTRGLSTPASAHLAVSIAATNDWTRRNFARWLFEDYPRALIATPRRWRRGTLNKPGAYQNLS